MLQFAKTITPSLQTLRRLQLEITTPNEREDSGATLCDELEEISGMNKLESVEITFKVEGDCHTVDEWGRLDMVFLKSGWPKLKHVCLAIVIDRWWEMKATLMDLSRTHFAGLTSSKNLDFQFSVRET